MNAGSVRLAVAAGLFACTAIACSGGGNGGSADGGGGSGGGSCSAPQSVKGTCLIGGSDGGTPLGCIEFTGSEFTLSTVQQACGSSANAQPCPSGAPGHCIKNCGQASESVEFTYIGTASSLQALCQNADSGMTGVWVSP